MGESSLTMAMRGGLRSLGALRRGYCSSTVEYAATPARAAPGTTAPSILKKTHQTAVKDAVQEVDLRHEIVDPVSSIPEAQLARKVFIFSPTKTAMQSGAEKVGNWKIEFENPERWRNPLMQWASCADPMSNLKMKFPSKETAVAYAEKMGFDYELSESVYPETNSNDRGIIKSYSDVFKWKGEKIRKRVFSI